MLGLGLPALAAWQALKGWSPLALWPTGTEPGMWIDPSNLTSQWQDSIGTTPVATPGTVADSSNPVGLALDLRLGAPDTLGPELVVNGDFSNGTTGWSPGILQGIPANITITADTTIFPSGGMKISAADYPAAGQTLSGLTVGKWYVASADLYSDSLQASVVVGSSIFSSQESLHRVSRTNEVENLSCFFVATSATMTVWCAKVEQNVGWQSGDLYVSNISVREVPGTHLLQSTSTARPLVSGRVNLLQYTADFTNWYWLNSGATVTPNYGTAPDGTQTSTRVVFAGANNYIAKANILSAPTSAAASCYVKGTAGETLYFANNLATGTLITLTGSWQRAIKADATGTSFVFATSAGATVRDVEVWHPQFELGTTATDYQAILTDGSTYSPTGFPYYQKYDGTDDGMATASFAAGTLTSAMDCMIAVRRDSAASTILGLAAQAVDSLSYFGACIPDTDLSAKECGTPTVWVDGVQLSGGTAVTRGTLNTAMTVGGWHILEYRDLDLSAWTALHFARAYTGFYFNGAQGGILLFPSSTPTADRDAARTWLGAKVGLTL